MKSLFLIAATAFCSLPLTASVMTRADVPQSSAALAGPLIQATEKSAASGKVTSAVAFSRMPIDQVQARLLHWLAQAKTDEATAKKVTAIWADKAVLQSLSAEGVLDLLMESFAIADDSVRRLMESCRTSGAPEPMNFEGVRSDAFFRDQVQLYHARWLTQHRFFDEAVVILESLNPETSVDPASLFFYRAVCRLRLLKPAEAGDDLALLLNNTLDVPPRFRTVAELMKEESGVSAEGLAQVARLMSDVQRRLDLGKSDMPVQKREDEVIAALDKLLEDMEKEKQQQQQSGEGGGGQQSQPGEQGQAQSTIKGAIGDGDADRKELTENGSWGMLDKQAETQAKELIRQQFPPNFLDAISRYTRKIAEQKK